jgi:hypothetical protein
VSAQLLQAAPPLPHALAVVVVTQLVPFQQPVQQTLLKHLPVPAAQLVPSVTAVFVQAPLEQESVVHSLLSSHEPQAAPPLPHTLTLVVPD